MASWSWHCAYCGRFVSWKADHYAPFGNSTDIEPPEEEYLCKRCVSKLEKQAIKEKRLPTHWHMARWEYRVAKKLGMVRAGPIGSSWSMWYMPNNLPEGYEIHE